MTTNTDQKKEVARLASLFTAFVKDVFGEDEFGALGREIQELIDKGRTSQVHEELDKAMDAITFLTHMLSKTSLHYLGIDSMVKLAQPIINEISEEDFNAREACHVKH